MTQAARPMTRTSRTAVDLNGLPLLCAALLIHTIGAQSLVVLPGLVQGFIERGGFTDKQAGLIASSETSGMALATVLMMFLVKKVGWRLVFLVSLILLIAGNFACISVRDFVPFCAIRCLVGIGAGALIALSYGVIGMTNKPDRNFGLCIMFVLTYGSVVFSVMPSLYQSVGLSGVLALFAALGVVGLPCVRFMPDSGEEYRARVSGITTAIRWPYREMALATVFLYFLACFGVWSYFFRIGVANGISEQQAGYALALSQFFGIAGAFTTAVMGSRFGRSLPLSFGMIGSVACLACLLGPTSPVTFAVIAALYNYVWNMTHPFLLGTLASFDRKGSMVVYGVAMQYLGTSAGPACAALVIANGVYNGVIWLGMSLFALSLMLILPAVRTHTR